MNFPLTKTRNQTREKRKKTNKCRSNWGRPTTAATTTTTITTTTTNDGVFHFSVIWRVKKRTSKWNRSKMGKKEHWEKRSFFCYKWMAINFFRGESFGNGKERKKRGHSFQKWQQKKKRNGKKKEAKEKTSIAKKKWPKKSDENQQIWPTMECRSTFLISQ